MSKPNLAVLDEIVTLSQWGAYESLDLVSAAYDVVIAGSEKDAQRAEYEFRLLSLSWQQSLKNLALATSSSQTLA